MLDLFNPAVVKGANEFARCFAAAQPFRHAVIDRFLAPDDLDTLQLLIQRRNMWIRFLYEREGEFHHDDFANHVAGAQAAGINSI